MDIAQLKDAFEMFYKVIASLKTFKDLLSGSKKEDAEKILRDAEKEFRLAEAKIAQELGYPICRCNWPPEIMRSIGMGEYGDSFQCPACKRVLSYDDNPPPLDNWRII
jgi:hypothetical protein